MTIMQILRTILLLTTVIAVICVTAISHALSLKVTRVDKTLKISIIGSPNQSVTLNVDILLTYPPEHTIHVSLSGVSIPTGRNSIRVNFENIREACIYLSLGIARVGRCLRSSSGSLTISRSNIPPGTYSLELLLVPLTTSRQVLIKVHVQATINLGDSGRLSLQYHIDSLRISKVEVSCNGIRKVLTFNVKTNMPLTTSGPVSTTETMAIKTARRVSQRTSTRLPVSSRGGVLASKIKVVKIVEIRVGGALLKYSTSTRVMFRGRTLGTLAILRLKVHKVHVRKLNRIVLDKLHVQHLRLLSQVYNITIENYTHVMFSRPITLCLPFCAEHVNISAVHVGYWNSTENTWILLRTTVRVVNTTYYACANVTHLTLFAVLERYHVVHVRARPYLVQIVPSGQQVFYLVCAGTDLNVSSVNVMVNSTTMKIRNNACIFVTFSKTGTYVISACADGLCNSTTIHIANYVRYCNLTANLSRAGAASPTLVLRFTCEHTKVRIRAVVRVAFDNGSKLTLVLSENRSLTLRLGGNAKAVTVRFAGAIRKLQIPTTVKVSKVSQAMLPIAIAATCAIIVAVALYVIARRRVSR